jgi:hypothetical protein
MSLSTQFTLRPPGTALKTAVLDAGSATSPAVFTGSQSGMYRDTGGALGIGVNGTPRIHANAGNVAVVGNGITAANVLTATHLLTVGGERKVDGLPAVQPTWRNLGSYTDPPTPALQLTLSNVSTYQNTVTNWGITSQPTLATRPTYVTTDPLDGKPAIAFDRTALQHLRSTTPVTFNCGTNGGMTLTIMLKFSGAVENFECPIFMAPGGVSDAIWIERNGLQSLMTFYIRNGATVLKSASGISISQDQWYIFSFRYLNIDGTWYLQVFRNGVKLSESSSTGPMTDRTLSIVNIGRQLSATQYHLTGSIRYLGVWDRPLSDAELAKVTEAARIYPDLQGVAPICRFLQGSRDSCLTESASDMLMPGPTGFPGGTCLAGAILLPDGRIFCPPLANSSFARIIDVRTNTVTTPTVTFPSNADAPYQDGVLMQNGQIYLVPRTATNALLVDIATETLSTPAGTLDGNTAYGSGVGLPDGRVFLVPRNATNALVYDSASNIHSTPSAVFPGNGAFSGGCLMSDGRVFCVPWNSTTARIFNPMTSEISTPSGTYPGAAAFAGGVLLPDSRIFMVPFNTTTARVYDAQTGTLSTPNGTYQTTGYRSGVLTACGRVAMIPYNAANAVLWDPQSDTLTTARGTVDTPSNSYWGGVLLPDGRIFMTPCNKTQAMYLHAGGWGLTQLPQNVLMSPWLNNKM